MSSPKIQISSEKPFILTHTPLVLSSIAVVLVIVFGGLWWRHVHDSPRRVFEGMLKNILTTRSVTRSTTSVGQQGYERIEQLSFAQPVAARTLIQLQQSSQQGQTTVTSETIGTNQADYSRYVSIDVKGGDNTKYKPIINVWGKSDVTTGQLQYLAGSTQGLLPFANLSPKVQTDFYHKIIDKKIYTVNYASTKPKKVGNKSAIDFSVTVKPAAYVSLLTELAKQNGIAQDLGLNPDDYKDQPDISLSIVVDKLSRQVLEVTYGTQKEVYSAYGVSAAIQTPETTIPFTELQQRIQAVQ